MGLIKTAEQILGGRPRPIDVTAAMIGKTVKGRGGRPALNRKCERVPGCTRPHRGHGLCTKHLHVENRWGDPLHVYVPKRPWERCGCPLHRQDRPPLTEKEKRWI
jgi:hypothetical protein